MDRQIYISQAIPGRSISKTLLLLASLREYGGRQADSPFWVLYPEAVGEFNALDNVYYRVGPPIGIGYQEAGKLKEEQH